MNNLPVRSSRAQLKVQQLAFVLVAFAIFFAIVAIFYLSLSTRSLSQQATQLRDKDASERVRKLSSLPELSWTRDNCVSCVDLDKALVFKSSQQYRTFFDENIKMVSIMKIYPSLNRTIECNAANYPACNSITLFKSGTGFATQEAFVALCRYDASAREPVCELGKLLIGVSSA